MSKLGFYKVATAVNKTVVANPIANGQEVLTLLKEAHAQNVSVVVFPELTLSSYTAGDLHTNQTLLQSQDEALFTLLEESKSINTVAIVGYALLHADRLYNTALIAQNGDILGVVPKTYVPNKQEFYEKRHFMSGKDILNQTITLCKQEVPFGVDLLFSDSASLTLGVEICEDLWNIVPPSFNLAASGANLLCNLSASNELIGKSEYREELVRTQSARCMAAYVYSSCGVGESTSDTVFGGHGIISEYGSTLAQSERFNVKSALLTAEVDLERLKFLRLNESSFDDAPRSAMRTIALKELPRVT